MICELSSARVFRAAFAETPNHCHIIRLGKSNQLIWVKLNCGKRRTIYAAISKLRNVTRRDSTIMYVLALKSQTYG